MKILVAMLAVLLISAWAHAGTEDKKSFILELGAGRSQASAKFDNDIKVAGMSFYGALSYGGSWKLRLGAQTFGNRHGDYTTDTDYTKAGLSLYFLDFGYAAALKVAYVGFDIGYAKGKFAYSYVNTQAGQTTGDYTSYDAEGMGPHARLLVAPIGVPGGLLGVTADYFLISSDGYDKKTLTSSTLTPSQGNGAKAMTVTSVMAVYLTRF